MEIGTGIVVTDPLLGHLWAVTKTDSGEVKMEDPYGVEEERLMPERSFQYSMKLGIWKFCWTFEEAKNWE